MTIAGEAALCGTTKEIREKHGAHRPERPLLLHHHSSHIIIQQKQLLFSSLKHAIMKNKLFITSLLTLLSICFLFSCSYSRYKLQQKYAAKFEKKTNRNRWKNKTMHQPRTKLPYAWVYDKGVSALHPTPVNNIDTYIHSYAIAHGLSFPQYFLMKADTLRRYLSKTGGYSPTQFLHAYLCSSDTAGNLDLAICGAFQNATGSNFAESDNVIKRDSIFGNFYTPFTCATVQDIFMEGINAALGTNPFSYLKYPGTAIGKIAQFRNPLISVANATNRIDTYELEVNQFPLATSFVMDTDSISLFLNNSAFQYNSGTGQVSPLNYKVPFVQIYLAYEHNDPDSMSIIMVGVDGQGNHIYLTPDGGNRLEVFNLSVPCPYCDVDRASLLNVAIQQ